MVFTRILDQNRSLQDLLSLRQKPAVAYAMAVGGVGLAGALRYALQGLLLDDSPFATFYPAILIAAVSGGFWPGTLATLLSVVTAWYLFVAPTFSFALDVRQGTALVLFALVAGFIVVVVSLLHGAADRLLIARERQELLTRELHHRSQNLFAVIQALVRRTLKDSKTLDQASENLNGRLMALSRAHTALARDVWKGTRLSEIIKQELNGFSRQINLTGCDIAINTTAAQNFALIIHELATNAIKYGALSSLDGSIVIEGKTNINGRPRFKFRWKELNGPPVRIPTRQGFGSTILLKLATQLSKDVKLEYAPDGLAYELRLDLSVITLIGPKQTENDATASPATFSA